MKKVLIISYYWPPSGGPGVQRILRFIQYLPELGWQPVILTVEKGDYPAIDEALVDEIPEQCLVYKTDILEPHRLFRKFTGKRKEEALPTYIMNKESSESLKSKLAKWIRANLFIPDARIGWLPYAVKAGAETIGKESIDLIFSSSPPHTVQLIGKRLAKKTGKKWIADFRDPWTEAFWASEFKKILLARKIDAALEKSVLTHADVVTTVSRGISKLLSAKAENDYEVILNGFLPIEKKVIPTDRFRILFFGHLSKSQPPQSLIEAVDKLPDAIQKQVEIVFVGNVFAGFSEIFEEYRHLKILKKDYMPHGELLEFAQTASMLFRPVAQSTYSQGSIGAKTFDYLALQKPILTLGKKPSVSSEVLAKTGSGELFEYGDIKGITEFILKYFDMWKKNKFVRLENDDKLSEYTTEFNVKKLVDIFNRTVSS